MSTEMLQELSTMVVDAVREAAPEDPAVTAGSLDESTVLFGPNGLLDSIGLVSVVVALEQAIEDRYNVSVALADEKALSQKNSPYRTIGALVRYAQGEIDAKGGHGG